ncbi:uncharacterized protein LOC131593556 [Vicia villosa]|uniref:uncharacterized protein LOC131593556 n=1 Tax=Vicia villosa TaxID=3911 RepID=UPI00273C92A3|nr:uncharacterized protein LOC131593556 [Vicia villosa]
MVTPFDLVTKRLRTMHARRTKETARRPRNPNSGQISQSFVPSYREEPTKEGSRSNHITIVKIVTQILNEDNVSSKIPGSENPVLPKSNIIGDVSDTAGTYVPTKDEMNENVHVSGKKINDVSIDHIEIPGGAEHNEEIPSNVSTNTCINHTKKGQTKEKEPEKTQTDKVINLDDLSNDDLVASINPSIARRLMRRKGKQVVDEVSQKKKTVAKSVSVRPKKAWSKVVPKKRKAIRSSENDVLRWKFVYQKRLALERELAQNALEYDEIMNLIHEARLMKTVTQLSKCYEVLVKEFLVNLHEDCGIKETEEYLKVFVRGKCINFSPTVINNFLERSNEAQLELEVSDNQMCKEITVGQVKTWPVKGKLTVSKLSVKYVVLHRIGTANWVPTQHKSTVSALLGKFIFAIGTKSKVDYGTYIFKQTLKHAGSYSVKGPIAFPSLICGIILKQFPNILTDKDSVCKRASPLIFHHKLFQRTHVHDVNTTSAGPSNENTIMNTDVEEQGEDDGGSDSEIEKEANPKDCTDNSVEFSSFESED